MKLNDEQVLEKEHALILQRLYGYKERMYEDFLLHAGIKSLASGDIYKAVMRKETGWECQVPNDLQTRVKHRYYDLWINGKTYKMQVNVTPGGAGNPDRELYIVTIDNSTFTAKWLWELVQNIIKYNKSK